MKKLICTAAAVLVSALALFACGGSNTEYAVPVYGDGLSVEIGTYVWPRVDLATKQMYADAADAGFNLIGVPVGSDGYTIGKLSEVMDYAEELGLKVLVSDAKINFYAQKSGSVNFETYFPQYKDKPAFYGNSLGDEPNVDDWQYVKTLYDAYKAAAPGKTGFINICQKGEYSDNFETQVNDWMDFMRAGEHKLDRLSYDMYPLVKNSWTGEVIIKTNYFTDLEIIKRAAVNYGVTAHNYILSVRHEGAFVYPQPTERSMRWQIAVDMAFGLEAFTHFTYWTPGNAETGYAGDNWWYDQAAIARDGTKTEIYGFMKTVNNEVLAWDHVYLSYSWKGVSYIPGNGDINWALAGLKHAVGPDEIGGITGITSDGDLLCGIFEDERGNKGFMLTNASNPYGDKPASVAVTFDGAYKGAQVFEKGEPQIYGLGKGGGITINLEPGEGKFIIPLKAK